MRAPFAGGMRGAGASQPSSSILLLAVYAALILNPSPRLGRRMRAHFASRMRDLVRSYSNATYEELCIIYILIDLLWFPNLPNHMNVGD